MTIWFDAPAPVGAPLAMSTDGAGLRSARAPATPSMTHRPIDGSNALHVSNAPNSGRARSQLRPPSVERDMIIWPSEALAGSKPYWKAKTYATPRESVRTVQPVRPKPCRVWTLFAAEVRP